MSDEVTLYRPHKGSLDAAMAEVVEVNGREELVAHLRKVWMSEVNESGLNVTIENYSGIDERIGWDTHIVLVDGKPYGFTDGPIPDHHEQESG